MCNKETLHDTNTFRNVGRKTLHDTNTFHNVGKTSERGTAKSSK